MAENSQLSGNMKNSSTGTSSTNASSEAIGKHENEIVPHKISNHDKLVQTMVMVDGEWINVNDTNDQANMKDDMNKVNKKVVEAQKGIVEATSAADSAAKAADSAVSASKVNSDAITAQSAAISEAKSAISSANAAIQQTAANAASDAAKIRADVAQVQSEIDANKAANSASVETLKSDVSAAKQDLADVHDSLTKAQAAAEESQKLINDNVTKVASDVSATQQDLAGVRKDLTKAQSDITANQKSINDNVAQINADITQDRKDIASAQQANADTAKQLDTYSKQAAVQGKTIKSIQDKQDGFTATLADVQGNVSQVSDKVDGLSASLKDTQSNVATVKAQADQLNATLTDHAKSIATLTASAKELSSTLEDADGRLSKVEQTAKMNSSTLSDVQGDLSQVKQSATALTATLKDAQGNISTLQQKADSVSAQLASAQGDIATLQTGVDGVKATLASHDKTIHTLQLDSKSLKDDMADAQGNISSLQKSSTKLDSEFSSQDGRLSKVEQTAKEHTSTISDLGDKVANMKIGGRNLIAGTSSNWTKVTNDWGPNWPLNPDEWKAGDTITISAEIRNGSQNIFIGFYNTVNGQTNTVPSKVSIPAGKEGRLTFTYKLPEGTTGVRPTVFPGSGTGTFEYRKLKAEKGNVATDWAPAPEDLTTAIQKNSTDIDQTKQKISLKADQTEVDKIKNTATQNSSRLDVMAGQISSKVTATDVNNIVDGKGYATTSTVQSLITQKAGMINESITNLTNKVNSNNGGGINLLQGTAKFNFPLNNNGGTQTVQKYDDETNYIQHTSNTPIDRMGPWWPLAPEVGQVYTLSADVCGNGYIQGEFHYEGGESGSLGRVNLTNDWQRISNTFRVNTISGNWVIYANNSTLLKVKHIKIERGSVATPWTPAPSDNATVTQVQQITASIDGLQSTVANKADKSQITQLSNLVQSKVSSADFNSKITQLSNDINLRVTKGDMLSQINVEAGRTLIQSNKIYFDADSFVMSPNSKAFIPSAFITNLSADKITTGTLDASKLHVKNFSADNISGGTLSGITVKTGDKNRYFQTSKDSIYWVRDNKTSLIGTDQYINPSDGLVIADTHSVTLTTWYGATVKDDGTITNGSGNIGYPKLILDSDGKWEPDASGGSRWEGNTGKAQIGQWIADKEYTNLVQGKGFVVHLDDQNKDSIFAIQKDNCVGAYFGRGEHGNHIDFVTVGDDQAVNITGNFHVTGSKNSIVETKQGYLAINAYETAEYYFGDIGESNTGDTSQITIGIDRIFNETVNTDIQYQVFVTPYSDAHVWVEKRYNNRFVVKSDKPNAEFGWELKAKRRGYESNRLRRVNVDFDQANIKGDN